MNNPYYAVIMAGGGGTRLWPLSRQTKPKQMLRLGSERTLFQLAIDRLKGLFPPERILVVTVADQAIELQKQVPEIPEGNFLLEPMPRGTASVVGLAAAVLRRRNPEAVMAVLTADHVIRNVEYFQLLLRVAKEEALTGRLVTLGIQPSIPSTAYGYIQHGELIHQIEGQPVNRVVRFKEKPDRATAGEMIRRGDHNWNSGMFIWRVSQILAEFERLMPDLAWTLTQIEKAWDTSQQEQVIETLWPQIKPETIDYGIMERASNVVVLPAVDLGWNDVGSWDSLFDFLDGDDQGNIVIGGQHISIQTGKSLVMSDKPSHLIATIGVEDLVIIATDDVTLVCSRAEAQKVKEAVQILKQTDRHDYL